MKIEKNVPMPFADPRLSRKRDKSLAQVEGMEVGDSVLHPYDEYDYTLHARLKASAVYYGRKNGTKYETRNMDNGIRIWRVA